MNVLGLLLLAVLHGSFGNPDAKRLYDDLLSGYNRLTRPVPNHTSCVAVKLGLKLTQLIDVDEKNQIMKTNVWLRQEWVDYKLAWNPLEYGGVDVLYVPSQLIWVPDLVLYNNADGNYQVTLMTKATIYPSGLVVWEPPAIYKSFCPINVEFFPFDKQECHMKFGSWTYNGWLVDLSHLGLENETREAQRVVSADCQASQGGGGDGGGEQTVTKADAINLDEFYPSVEWDVLEVPAVKSNIVYPCCPEPFIDITFYLHLRRKTLFYSVNLIIPCVSLSFLTVCTFYLPSDSGEKISLSISILVSLTVFFLLLSETIPPTSLVVPLIGKYLLFTMILVTLSVCVTVYVLNVHYRSPVTHTMAPWVRRVFIQLLPRLLLMRRPQFEKDKTYLSVKECSKRFSGLFSDDAAVQRCGDIDSPYSPEIRKAMGGVIYIAEHLQREDEVRSVREDWKYVAMTLDRLFLYCFSIACFVGSCGIILQADTFFDTREPLA
ncbi:PREDICTED: acetylcholine receptor subunit alpha-like isoform X2 [Priapulus caudatus]|uniref:Acetylcholine receptor subunit alpha-like isoform X1 n=1 Tax=Priapulus caudatus TaxID=37621 RepID=A0ABM1FBF5_PRICU|nr:PREDICTED: acetylcholine receptor subunit alpha-like isoform X1 [Priapulus caudatus]XP_014681776.1 PREDICTED: acetylcholine receptor subunit alpha-like isoform X2 [Priapulus caudatus]